jgi:hypothetical protein
MDGCFNYLSAALFMLFDLSDDLFELSFALFVFWVFTLIVALSSAFISTFIKDPFLIIAGGFAFTSSATAIIGNRTIGKFISKQKVCATPITSSMSWLL